MDPLGLHVQWQFPDHDQTGNCLEQNPDQFASMSMITDDELSRYRCPQSRPILGPLYLLKVKQLSNN